MLGARHLGDIPFVQGSAIRLSSNEETPLTLAMQQIRTRLVHHKTLLGHPKGLVIATQSPSSGDGKSFFAETLARSFSRAKVRVVLVDA
jgi:Mrp family chromosome partitioning ATPase